MNILYLYQMFPNKEKRMQFIAKCALTYGVILDTLSEILKQDKDNLYEKILYYNPNMRSSLILLFNHGMRPQEEAKRDFINYFNELCELGKNKDKEQIQHHLEKISDKKASEVIKKHSDGGGQLTNEELLIILRYQIKYMLNTHTISKIFNVDRNSYARRVRKLEDQEPRLISDFDYLTDYYANVNQYIRNSGRY